MRKYLLIGLLFAAACACAQPLVISPETHPDSTITFRLYAPEARHVKLESDCLYKQPDNSWFGGHTKQAKMRRDSLGVWTYTTKPLMPEVYQYRFVVDGKKIHDPVNPDSTHILLHIESVVALGGNSQADLFVNPPAGTPRGRLDTTSYYSPERGYSRGLIVYLPPEMRDSLPVIYLLHGISGDEYSWMEIGRVAQVFDNLLAQGKIRPMVVVMPDCNVPRKVDPKKRTNMLRNVFDYPQLRAGAFEDAFEGMHQYVCRHYAISSKQKDHYIAGLSSGAMQAANIVRNMPEDFIKVGIFSPALMKEEQYETHRYGREACVPCVDTDVQPSYFLACGKKDLFYKDGLKFAQLLRSVGLTCEVYENNAGHTWRSWREYLCAFLLSLGNTPQADAQP